MKALLWISLLLIEYISLYIVNIWNREKNSCQWVCHLVLGRSGVLVGEDRMKYTAANHKPLPWCTIITLPSVALFHFYLTTELHWTMDPADLKVPVSFLQGWWTPHLSSLPQHEHCCEGDFCVWGRDPCQPAQIRIANAAVLLFVSGNWLQAVQLFTMLNNVVLCAYHDWRSLSEGWLMTE